MSVRAETEKAIDFRLLEVRQRLYDRTHGEPLNTEAVQSFMRAAYGKGYCDQLADRASMAEEYPMMKTPELLLP